MKYSTSNFQKANQFKINEDAEGTVLSKKNGSLWWHYRNCKQCYAHGRRYIRNARQCYAQGMGMSETPNKVMPRGMGMSETPNNVFPTVVGGYCDTAG